MTTEIYILNLEDRVKKLEELLDKLIDTSLDMRDAWDQQDAYLNFEGAIYDAAYFIKKKCTI